MAHSVARSSRRKQNKNWNYIEYARRRVKNQVQSVHGAMEESEVKEVETKMHRKFETCRTRLWEIGERESTG